MSEHPRTEAFDMPPRIHDAKELSDAWQTTIPDEKTRAQLLQIGIPSVYRDDPDGYLEKIGGNVFSFIERMRERGKLA